MKNIYQIIGLITIILTAFVLQVNAQKHHEKPQLDKYVGTWEWRNGNDKFRIILTKQKLFIQGDDVMVSYYSDVIVGWHEYIKNGKIIESSMDKANRRYTNWDAAAKECTIIGSVILSNALHIYFDDITLNDNKRLKLELLPGNTDEMRWILNDWMVDRVQSPGNQKDFTVPVDLILKKVK